MLIFLVLAALVEGNAAERATIAGTYVNADYGYSVALPAGHEALGATPPAPNHGFRLLVPECSAAQVWVDASYNSTFLPTLDAIADQLVGQPGWPPHVTKKRVTVAGLSGIEVSAPGNVAIVVLRSVPGEVGIIYTLSIQGVGAEEKRCMSVFRTLVRGFVLKPVTAG